MTSLPLLPEEPRAFLRRHALASAIAAVLGRPLPEPPAGAPPEVEEKRGVFASVFVETELRGCMGTTGGRDPLLRAAGRFAAAAATRDQRFRPVHEEELPRFRLELSVLGPLIAVDRAGDVSGKGVHGVVVQLGGRTGVLLPQVAAREGWDGPTLVLHAAHKAGIGEHEIVQASLQVFSSESF